MSAWATEWVKGHPGLYTEILERRGRSGWECWDYHNLRVSTSTVPPLWDLFLFMSMSVCGFMHIPAEPWRVLELELQGCCELPNMGVGNCNWVLCKSSVCSLPLRCLPSPIVPVFCAFSIRTLMNRPLSLKTCILLQPSWLSHSHFLLVIVWCTFSVLSNLYPYPINQPPLRLPLPYPRALSIVGKHFTTKLCLFTLCICTHAQLCLHVEARDQQWIFLYFSPPYLFMSLC